MSLTITASVPSQSTRGRYSLVQMTDGSWTCNCPAWINQRKPNDRRSCKHMVQLVKELGQHIVDALEVPAN